MENIRYGRLDATDEEVIAAAKAARADHFIKTLPGGYQMELNEDASNVSQGQKQLLTIARAILADNKILILDEPTSMLDVSVQAQVMTLLKELQEKLGLSYLFISHDLDVVRWFCDEIAVMEEGKFVETGRTEDVIGHPKAEFTKKLVENFILE